MRTVTITDAAQEPLTLEEAKRHLKVDDTEDDPLIASLITTVRQACEAECQRTLLDSTLELVADAFTPVLQLRRPRVIEVLSVSYTDPAGQLQTLPPDAWRLDADSEPARLEPAPGQAWPATRAQSAAVRVRYRAGYGASPAQVPAALKTWMLLQLGHLYAHREAATAGSLQPLPYADGLLDPYRVWA